MRQLYEKSATYIPSTSEYKHLTKNYLFLIFQACPTNTFSPSIYNSMSMFADARKFYSLFILFGKRDVEEIRPFYKINGSHLQMIEK